MTRGRKPLPEGERMVVLAVRVPPNVAKWLSKEAARQNRSKSDEARDILFSTYLWETQCSTVEGH